MPVRLSVLRNGWVLESFASMGAGGWLWLKQVYGILGPYTWGPWKKRLPWLFRLFVGDEILPSYMGIIVNPYKDPYLTTRIQWNEGAVFFSLLT